MASSTSPAAAPGRSATARPSPRLNGRQSQAQAELDDHYLIALAKQGKPDAYDRIVRALLRLRPAQGLLVLPHRRRRRRPDPGGPRRALQGGSRLPLRPRVELPQLRGALHHAADHHGGQDLDPQQAHAAQRVRLLLADARQRRRRRRPHARRAASGPDARTTRSNQVISTEELHSLVACLSSVLSELESSVLSLYLDGHSYELDRRSAWTATRRRSTTRSSASSARSARTSTRARVPL